MDFTAKKEALADAINRNDYETVQTIVFNLPMGMLTEGTNELGQVRCGSIGILYLEYATFGSEEQ